MFRSLLLLLDWSIFTCALPLRSTPCSLPSCLELFTRHLVLIVAVFTNAGLWSQGNFDKILNLVPIPNYFRQFAHFVIAFTQFIKSGVFFIAPALVAIFVQDESNGNQWHIIFYMTAASLILVNQFNTFKTTTPVLGQRCVLHFCYRSASAIHVYWGAEQEKIKAWADRK